MADPAASLISIGEFARRTRLTPKALRLYHELGLLPPVSVDPNGYRRYDPAQIRREQLIGLLRGAELSLAEIRVVLGELQAGVGPAVELLRRLLDEAERRHANRAVLIRHIQATLREGSNSMFAINVRQVPPQRVMSIQRRLRAPETAAFARGAKAAFIRHLNGDEPTGPFMLIFPDVARKESDGPLEAVLGCPEDVQPTDLIGIRKEPAHEQAYTTITKAQWAYPAILAAYDAVACSPLVTERPRSGLSCREIYLAASDEIGESDPICDVAFPLGADEEPPQRLVERDQVEVMFRRAADDQPAITRAWTELEEAVGSLRGRKFYGVFDHGVFDPRSHEYRACVEVEAGDDAEALGLERGMLPGGRYARVRLVGEPPAVYAQILPASKKLAQRPDADRQAPSIEFYRRRDVIDLLQPLA